MYSTMQTTSYFVPYYKDVFQVAVTFSGVLGVLNLYGGRLFSPILGRIARETKYVSRMIVFGACTLIVFIICILLFASYVPIAVLMGASLVTGIVCTLFTNICLALPPEANVDRRASGTAMGLYAAIAYSPDLFQHSLFGYWLDTYGNAGYVRMFIFSIILLTVGAVSAFILYKRSKKSRIFE